MLKLCSPALAGTLARDDLALAVGCGLGALAGEPHSLEAHFALVTTSRAPRKKT